jgi:2,3-bisphosphoglycerate-independent phosphoglycerate mutase
VKALLVIADGMADVPLKKLGLRTPLEAATTPALNRVAESGICGLMDVIAPGVPPGSDTAHLALLGYDVMEVYSGRGALEALGSGVDVLPNDIAFRCNFATVDSDWKVIDRRAGRIENDEASQLTVAIRESIRNDPPEVGDILFSNTVQHRAILRLGGPNLSTMVSDTDPQEVGVKVANARALDDSADAKRTADILNELTEKLHRVLSDNPLNKEREKRGQLPANIVLCRGVGQLPEIDPLPLLYDIHPAAISAVPLVRGVCKVAGMRLLPVAGATGTYTTDFMAKAKAALEALQHYDFVLVHLKAPDLAGHDGVPQKKIEIIERVDALIGHFLAHANLEETFVVVTADHTTSSIKKEHSGEPVPIAITGPNIRTDDVKEFGERTCAQGGLGHISGRDLMPILLNFLGKSEKAGS